MSNSNSSKQILLSVIGVAILVVAVVGISFAFFNYSRTGLQNTIRTGTISFNTSNSVINISNLFPINKDDVATNETNVGLGTVTITGNTNYTNGIDFVVTAEEVSNTIGTTAGKLPISIKVSKDTNLNGVTEYGSNSGSMTLNSYEDGTTISSGSVLASGRIPANTSINGTITIKAYLDEAGIAITDTYYATAPTPSPSGSPLASPNDEYGTTSNWVNGRTVLSTEEWNNLSSIAASFKIKVVANQGS